MPRKVIVQPKSKKAVNRLCNSMDNNPVCIVEQDDNGMLFLASENGKYFFWVNTQDSWECDWEIV